MTGSIKAAPPFPFVMELLEAAGPITKPMFGCLAVYVGPKIVLILRERKKPVRDDGVWICTTVEHHRALRAEYPSLRNISIFADGGPTGWQNLPSSAEDFETSVEKVCRAILQGDPRIGKVPGQKKAKSTKAAKKVAKKSPSKKKKK